MANMRHHCCIQENPAALKVEECHLSDKEFYVNHFRYPSFIKL